MDSPVHDSRAIANLFVQQWKKSSDGPLTIMSLLKYVYFAHGWTLGHTGKPLFSHKVEAWKYGPVVPEVYKAFSPQSSYNVTEEAKKYSLKEELSSLQNNIVNGVYREYSKLSPMDLSAITHAEGSPWYRYQHTFYGEIPNEEIERHYKKLVDRMKNKNDGQ